MYYVMCLLLIILLINNRQIYSIISTDCTFLLMQCYRIPLIYDSSHLIELDA